LETEQSQLFDSTLADTAGFWHNSQGIPQVCAWYLNGRHEQAKICHRGYQYTTRRRFNLLPEHHQAVVIGFNT
jgi:hypothetical protein